MGDREVKIQKLKDYFETRDDVVMAFVFGSQAEGRVHSGSDWDIAVYFKPEVEKIEWEEHGREYPEEDHVWSDCREILQSDNVDLVVLNRAPATIADAAIRGISLVEKDRNLFLRFMLIITGVAEDFREFTKDYYEIFQRSQSLTPNDADRLRNVLTFIGEQMQLYGDFNAFDQAQYMNDIHKRNDVERWVENCMNAAIDIAKIVLSSELRATPHAYRESVVKAAFVLHLSEDAASHMERWIKLRNVLAHEYLDIKWLRIKNFIDESKPYMEQYVESVKRFLEENSADAT